MTVKININPNVFLPCYRDDVEDYSHRYNIFWGGRGSGKTKYIIQKLVVKGLKEKRLILLMRKETNKLKDSVWQELKTVISEWNLTNYFEYNNSELRATCTLTGTEFKCLGLDESEKIKSFANISDAFLDELTAFTKDDFDLIDGTIRSILYKLSLQIYGAFNPISKLNWVYRYFGFDTGNIPDDTYISHSTYKDNPFLDASFIRRMENLKKRDYNRWKIEALGEFVSLDKLVFSNWRTEAFAHAALSGDLLVGLDFGFVNDITALIASIKDEENKRIYIFKEYGSTGKTNDEIARIIKSLGFAKSTIIADSAEMKSIEELKRAGIRRIKPSKKGKDSIIHGIQKLQQYEIIIHPDCEDVISEFENYAWKKDKKTGEYTNEPVDKFNHFIDALRYSLQCSEGKTKLKTMKKSKLGL